MNSWIIIAFADVGRGLLYVAQCQERSFMWFGFSFIFVAFAK